MIDKILDYLSKILMVGFVVANFVLQSAITAIPIIELLKDFWSILYIVFSIFAQMVSANAGFDDGINKALEIESFIKADNENNEIIGFINDNFEDTLKYLEQKNINEKKMKELNFLLAKGVSKVENLTPKQLKAYKKLRPDIHTGKDINLPLYTEFTKGGVHSYATNFDASKGRVVMNIKQVLMGLIFGLLSINIAFRFSNFSNAFSSTLVLMVAMITAYGIKYLFNYNKLTKKLPKLVKNKNEFYQGLKKYIEINGGVANERDQKVVLQLPVEYEDTNNGGE